ncbi:MAG: hypothetical protein AB7S70_00625 [Hyphomicrobium sp.]|uniref:hypothetical protein n=1 Tax=Hyphomicrobium sp. TaxID=82 RepID=UPI003D10FFE2
MSNIRRRRTARRVVIAPPPAGGGAPTFIQATPTAFNSTTTPKTTASFDVLAGDVLVAYAFKEDDTDGSSPITISDNTGGALTWTSRQEIDASNGTYCYVRVWTTVVDSNRSMTVSFARNTQAKFFGGCVQTWRGSSGAGTSAKNMPTTTNGAPTLDLTTTQANSAIAVAVADWNASDGASRTWRSGAGAITPGGAGETTYFRDADHYTLFAGYHADAGAIGTYAVGLTQPNAQRWSIAAVEVKGQ